MKKINFYSGPAIMPQEVMEELRENIREFRGTGLSLLEISHRSKAFMDALQETRALVKEVLKLDNNREVLFLHGGAQSQFYMVPMNLLSSKEDTAAYFDTGHWAHMAMEEGKTLGNVYVACSSRDKKYTYIPADYTLAPDTKYLHFTTNNTVYGTQLHGKKIPYGAGVPLVCDMSSDICSRELDFNRFDLIYACVQKNLGAAGTTMVVINKETIRENGQAIPSMLNYYKHIAADNMLNTPPVFSIYSVYLTLQWIKKRGLKAIEETNVRKAEKLYRVLDASTIFKPTVTGEDRSLMNVCFTASDKETEKRFLAFADTYHIAGIAGHREVGGFRASIYNAMPESGIDTLIEAMSEFERKG